MRAGTRLKTRAIARGAAALGLLLAAAGCGTAAQSTEQVTIMVPWGGAEFAAFYQLVEDFQNATHIHVNVEVTRAQTEQLDAALDGAAPPDLAVLPSVGAVDKYAGHGLQQLQGIATGTFLAPFRSLMSVGGAVYAVPVKADVKSLIWYDPRYTATPPADPAGQRALAGDRADFWCLGLESGPTSGWPGADWIADLFLEQNGVAAYETWLTAPSPQWRTQSVETAWSTWGGLIRGNDAKTVITPFGDAAAGMTSVDAKTGAPSCRLAHGALAAMDFPADLEPGRDYDFVAPSAPVPLEVSADFLGIFTKYNPAALTLMRYLISTPAQTAWVRARGGYAFSASDQVPVSAYPGPVEQHIAALLRPDSGHPLCFGAADLLTPDMSTAFYQAVVNYAEAPSAQAITDMLAGLQASQTPDDQQRIAPAEICSTPS